VDFLGYQPGLRRGCFLAMDAVKWMMENVNDVPTRKEAVKIFQVPNIPVLYSYTDTLYIYGSTNITSYIHTVGF